MSKVSTMASKEFRKRAVVFIVIALVIAIVIAGLAVAARHRDSAAATQQALFKQTIRVWVHGDRVSPDVIYAGPGRLLLEAENETAGDINLKFERQIPGGNPEVQGVVRTARRGKRAALEVTLGAGEFVFYDEARPGIRGKLIIDPQFR